MAQKTFGLALACLVSGLGWVASAQAGGKNVRLSDDTAVCWSVGPDGKTPDNKVSYRTFAGREPGWRLYNMVDYRALPVSRDGRCELTEDGVCLELTSAITPDLVYPTGYRVSVYVAHYWSNSDIPGMPYEPDGTYADLRCLRDIPNSGDYPQP